MTTGFDARRNYSITVTLIVAGMTGWIALLCWAAYRVALAMWRDLQKLIGGEGERRDCAVEVMPVLSKGGTDA